MRIRTLCPHCRELAIARTSREVSRTMKEIIYQCTDAECSHSFVVMHEAVRTLSPSAKPSAAVSLPISQHTRDRVMKQLELIG
ncbi:ogr/Delta-like zinc finger family protein [Paraburkholderia bryophila]|uniref:ogr/Delta-like zinc finger family protein n=1 Tax=Paraburkholderia bryophila TaxID=420952 RepID=UPI000DCF8918|nr:ogr/Delta-like zinc finger family protein [Paraburkholderia bryophila]